MDSDFPKRLNEAIARQRKELDAILPILQNLRDRLEKEKKYLSALLRGSSQRQLSERRRYLKLVEEEISKKKKEVEEILIADRRLCDKFSDGAKLFLLQFSTSSDAAAFRRRQRQVELEKLSKEWKQMKIDYYAEAANISLQFAAAPSSEKDRLREARQKISSLESGLSLEENAIKNLRQHLEEKEKEREFLQRFPADHSILKEKERKLAKLKELPMDDHCRAMNEKAEDLRAKLSALRRAYEMTEDDMPEVRGRSNRRGTGGRRENSTRGKSASRGRGGNGQPSTSRGRRRGSDYSGGRDHGTPMTGACSSLIATAREAGYQRGPRQTLITSFIRREIENDN